MWVNYHSLSNSHIAPQQLLTQYPQRRPMVPRLRQATVVPKTVVTVYHDANSPPASSKVPFYHRLIKRWFKQSNSVDQKQSESLKSLWARLTQFAQRDNILILSLMFADVLVNTAMLILNYTMLVIDFFDDIEWSTAVTKVETANTQDGSNVEQEYYAQYLLTRKAFMEKLNLIIYVLIYIAQLVGFYGVIREIESLVITYVTVVSIQVIVLCFTVALRPFWLPVCLLRIVLFVLALKQCLRLSNRNMSQEWDWSHCPDNKLNHSEQGTEPPTSASNASESHEADAHDQERRRSQTMPSGSINSLSVAKRDRKINSTPHSVTNHQRFATSSRNRLNNKPNGNKNSIDETSVIEVMASISHVVNIPVPTSTFDTDSNESS